jgi:hypothetical protein
MREKNTQIKLYQKYISFFIFMHIPIYFAVGYFTGLPSITALVLQSFLSVMSFTGVWL